MVSGSLYGYKLKNWFYSMWGFLVILMALTSLSFAENSPLLSEMVSAGEFKKAISVLDKRFDENLSEKQRAFLLVEKAKILFADQQHMEASDVFLHALQYVKVSTTEPSVEEKIAFQSLIPLYETSLESPVLCEKLVQEAEEILRKHAEYVSLELYVATGLANRGQFIPFFDRFFHAFEYRSDCFLSWKIRGVLLLRLYESASIEEKRVFYRKEAVRCLREAFRRQPQDTSLIVKIMFILPPEEKRVFLQSVVDDFMRIDAAPKRLDCFFLIEQALDLQEKQIAKKLIDKARVWYQYSRALNDLSERCR